MSPNIPPPVADTTFGLDPTPEPVAAPVPVDPPRAPRAPEDPNRDRNSLIADLNAYRRHSLQSAIGVALQTSPDAAAEARRLGLKFNVDSGLIEMDLDGYREVEHRLDMDRWAAQRSDPVLHRQMADPEFARIAHDDLRELGQLERSWNTFQYTRLVAELGVLDYNSVNRQLSAAEEIRREELRAYIESTPPPERPGTLLAIATESGAYAVQMMPHVLMTAFTAGLTTAAYGAAVPTPEEVVTVPVTVAAAAAGAAAGTFDAMRRISTGIAYRQNLASGMSHDNAWLAANIAGVAEGMLEIAGLGFVARGARIPVSALRRQFYREVGVSTVEAMARPKASKAVVDFAKGVLIGNLGETATEVAQDFTNAVAEDLGRILEGMGSRLQTPEGQRELISQMGETFGTMIQGMLLLSLPGPGGRFIHDMRRAQTAIETAEKFDKATDAYAATKTGQRSPETAQRLSAETLKASKGKTVYIEAAKVDEALRQTGVGRDVLQQKWPEVDAQLDDALATGGDVVIPTARYHSIIDSPLETELRPHVRFGELEHSAAEAKTVMALAEGSLQGAIAETTQESQFREELSEVRQAKVSELNAAGLPLDEARAEAELFSSFVDTQSRGLEITPKEFLARFPTRIIRAASSAATSATTATESPTLTRSDPNPLPEQETAPPEPPTTVALSPRPDTVEVPREQTPPNVTDEATGETLQQRDKEVRGDFTPATGLIRLFEKAAIDTVFHELGHYFLNSYSQIASSEGAPQHVVDDMNAFLKWRGIEGGVDAWNAMSFEEQRPHHEAFAEAFENYLYAGRAPTVGLQRLFSRVRRWMVNLWRGVRNQVIVDPEIAQVFDRMLASQDAIEHTEAVRGLLSVFEQKPDNMTDAAWTALKVAEDDAIEAAIAEVQKRSLRDLQWLSRARGRVLRELQRKHDAIRDAIRDEITTELEAEPVYRAIKFLKTGIMVTEGGTTIDLTSGPFKLNTDAVRELFPERDPASAAFIDLKKLQITTPQGLDPDTVADRFGFPSGAVMIQAIADARPFDELVAERTDSRMLREHGDLIDAAEVQKVVDEALHNPLRAKFLATELRALMGATQPVRILVAAAREAARITLEGTPVAQIKAWRYRGAETRANRAAVRAASKGNTAEAILEKRNELFQHELARLAIDVEKEVIKAEGRFVGFGRDDKSLARYRDLDFIHAGRFLLASVGAAEPAATDQERAQQQRALEVLAKDFQAVYESLTALKEELGGRPYRSLTLGEFRALFDAADSLWNLSRSSKLITIEGTKMELANVVGQLASRVQQHPERAKSTRPPDGITPTGFGRTIQGWWQFLASGKRMQHWVQFMDRLDKDGPFQRFILYPMFARVDEYRKRRDAIFARQSERLDKLMEFYGARWDANIDATEDLNFTFRGVRQLVDVLLDIGNFSNLAKRLVGEKWALRPQDNDGVLDTSRWDDWFNKNLQTPDNPNGVITPELMDYVKSVWDEFEALREEAQNTHREVLGYEFEELPLREIVLPWGVTLKGGYAPVRVDRARARNPRTPLEGLDTLQTRESEYLYSRQKISTDRGFTLNRNPNYFDALTIDIGRRLQAIDEELQFIYLQPHVRNVLRILNDRTFRDVMNAYDREAITNIIEPWLESTARQSSSRRGLHPLLDAVATILRTGTGAAYLGLNFTVAAVQLTGLVSAKAEVKAKFRYSALGHVMSNPSAAWRNAASKSVRMDHRLNTHARKIRQALSRQSLSKPWRTADELRQGAIRFGWMPIRFAQGFVDVITWHAAYEQSIAEASVDTAPEVAERNAIRDADQAVERSQGASNPENLARYEADTPFMKLFFQFMTFSNNMLNQSLVRAGLSETKAAKVANFLWLPIQVTLLEAAIRTLFAGEPDDDEDYLTAITKRTSINFLRNVGGMLPMFGPSLVALASGEADRVGTAPAGSALRTAIDGIVSVIEGDPDPSALGVLGSVITGIPFKKVGELVETLAGDDQ